MWEDFYLPSQLLENKCRVLLSERFYWEFWRGGLGFSVEVPTGFHSTQFGNH